MSPRVRVYSTLICPYCIRAKALLKSRGIPYEAIDVTGDSAARAWLVQATGRRTVPQIFIDEEPIGGFDEMRAMDASGELSRRLGHAASIKKSVTDRRSSSTPSSPD